jgi:hypothetical protein
MIKKNKYKFETKKKWYGINLRLLKIIIGWSLLIHQYF